MIGYRYDNWVAAMIDWREVEHSQKWHDWVQKAFEAFDVDGSGSIGIKDLQNMLCQGEICVVSFLRKFEMRLAPSIMYCVGLCMHVEQSPLFLHDITLLHIKSEVSEVSSLSIYGMSPS